MNGEQKHNLYLNNLVHNLSYIGIDKSFVNYVIQEPLWWRESNKQYTLCDLIIGYMDGTCSALELKGSKCKRSKAISQINAGKEFINIELNKQYKNGIFVVYLSPKNYYYEIID